MENVSSFKQLCRINASLQSFAAVADKAAAEVEGVQEAWMDEIQHMVDVAEFVTETQDLAQQRRLLYNLEPGTALHQVSEGVAASEQPRARPQR